MFASRSISIAGGLVCLTLLALTGRIARADEGAIPPGASPATQPTTSPSVSADTRALLNAIDAAYGKLTSLDMAGTISQDVRIGGRKQQSQMPFTSSFTSPNYFRHEVPGNILCGSTGDKAYAYLERQRLFTSADAPKARVAANDLPKPLPKLLDCSLALAIAEAPSTVLIESATEISKANDATVDGVAYPTLVVKDKAGQVTTYLFDPKTSLLHRSTLDARPLLEARGLKNIESATLSTDYTTVTPNAELKPAQFAWTPPEGARDAASGPAPGEEAAAANGMEGKDAPDFKLAGLDDKQVSLADLKGSVAILDFWATWCPPCRASLPHLAEVYAKFKDAGLKVYAVNCAEDKETVKGFVDQTKLAVPVLLDTDHAVSEKYGANAIPETVVIGKDGKVRKVFVGFSPDTEEQLTAAVKAALAE